MTKPKLKHINRRLTDKERARHEKIRAEVAKEFPLAIHDKPQPADVIAAKICREIPVGRPPTIDKSKEKQ